MISFISLLLVPATVLAIDGNESFSGFSAAGPAFETPASVVEEPDQVSDTEARYQLAKILLYKEESWKEAVFHVKLLMQADPQNVQVRLLYARYLLMTQNYREAKPLIDRLMNEDLSDPYDLIDLGGMQAELGYAVVSRALFQKVETKDERILEFWKTQFAIAAELWGDWVASETVLKPRALAPHATLNDQLALANLYLRSHKYAEAEQLYLQIVDKDPYSRAYLDLISLKIQLLDFDAAACLLADAPETIRTTLAYQTLQAEYYFHSHQYDEALKSYLALANDADSPLKQAFFFTRAGEAARHNECQEDKAHALFEKAHQLNPAAVRPRYFLGYSFDNTTAPSQEVQEWANCLIEDGCIEEATALLEEVQIADPLYFPGPWALADLYSMKFRYEATLEIYSDLFATFPDSQMILLQLARAYSWIKEYDLSIALYNRLMQDDPQNSLFVFEKAHVALWSQNYPLSWLMYCSLLDPEWVEAPTIEDFARWQIHMTACLELEAKKAAWYNLPLEGLSAFERYLAFRPNNTEALFEYAQLYQILGTCCKAASIYDYILELEPNHSLAQMVLGRIAYQESPKVADSYTLWSEEGYGVLSAITRHKILWKVQAESDCQTQAAVYQVLFSDHPYFNGGSFVANGLGVEYSRVVNERFSFQGAYTRKVGSSYHLHYHNLGLAQATYRFNDRWLATVGYDRADEFYNYFGIKQGIQSDAYWTRLSWNTTRDLRIEGYYRYLRYTDDNFLNNAMVNFNYQFTDFPKIWRASLQGEYRNTAHPAIEIFVGPQLVDIIHPYWCPQDYFAGRLVIEYYHDLAFFNFVGAEKNSYLLRLTVGDDTDNNHAISGGFEWHYDWGNRWSAYLSGLAHYSPLWKAAGLWAQLSYAF